MRIAFFHGLESKPFSEKNQILIEQCWSEWSGGGYKPYSSKEGKEEHDYLVREIYKIINS